mgnify:CR=1 FL=1
MTSVKGRVYDILDIGNTVCQIILRKKEEDMFQIPMGNPLMQFIPLTEKKIKIHNHVVTEEELKTKIYNVTGTAMGWRRTISLVRRNDKREKKCPFGFGD